MGDKESLRLGKHARGLDILEEKKAMLESGTSEVLLSKNPLHKWDEITAGWQTDVNVMLNVLPKENRSHFCKTAQAVFAIRIALASTHELIENLMTYTV